VSTLVFPAQLSVKEVTPPPIACWHGAFARTPVLWLGIHPGEHPQIARTAHTPGHLVFHEQERNVLFTTDARFVRLCHEGTIAVEPRNPVRWCRLGGGCQ